MSCEAAAKQGPDVWLAGRIRLYCCDNHTEIDIRCILPQVGEATPRHQQAFIRTLQRFQFILNACMHEPTYFAMSSAESSLIINTERMQGEFTTDITVLPKGPGISAQLESWRKGYYP